MDLSRWYNLRKQAQASVRQVSRAAQIVRSTIPVTMEDDGGTFEVDAPLPDAIQSGVLAKPVADKAAEDALQAAQDAFNADAKAQAALDGLGGTVVSSVIEYAVSTSDTTPPTSGWSTDNPAPAEGEFVWMRTVVTYQDETTATSSPVLMSRGGESVKIDSIKSFYALGAGVLEPTPPTIPTTMEPMFPPWSEDVWLYQPDATLFSTSRIVYSDGSFAYTDLIVPPGWREAGEAQAEADATRFLAEGLYQVIPAVDAPTTSPTGALKEGDQWWKVGTGDNAGQFVGVAVWDGAAWQDRQIVADSVLLPSSVGNILLKDGAIDGMVVTGATVRTAASGQRLELNQNGLGAYTAAGLRVANLSAQSGSMSISGDGLAVSNDIPNRYMHLYDTTLMGRSPGGAGFGSMTASAETGFQVTKSADHYHTGSADSGGSVTSTGLRFYRGYEIDSDTHRAYFDVSLTTEYPQMSLYVETDGSLETGAGYQLSKSTSGVYRAIAYSDWLRADEIQSNTPNGAIDVVSRMTQSGNTFQTKSSLDSWSDAPDGTHAWVGGWVGAENREYVRVNGVWVPWYDGAGDTDWATIPLATGWVVQQGQTPRWRIKGGWLQVSGRVGRSGGAVIGTSFANWTNGIPELVPHIGNIVEMPKSTPGAGVESTGLLRVMDNGRMQCAANGVAFFPNVEFLL